MELIDDKKAVDLEMNDNDLSDLLQELRILLQGAQVLTAFLIILPFNGGFAQIDPVEKWVYLATFMCSIISLVLFSTPAAQHRLQRPLVDKPGFKVFSTRVMIGGIAFLSCALLLATQLVINEVIGPLASAIAMGFMAIVILVFWWIFPIIRKK